jgi:DNA mismatch repair ATPase MutS
VGPLSSPHAEYESRLARWRDSETLENRAYNRISDVRLIVAIIAAVLGYLAFGPVVISAIWLLAPAAAFAILVLLHLRIDKRRQFARRGIRYYEQGLARLSDQWAGTGNAGDRFAEADHPFASDLDLFGRGSLFELVSTARTEQGEGTLASWLKTPATSAEARRRQQAVTELTPNVDLREQLMLLGEEIRAEVHTETLAAWASAPAIDYFAGARLMALLFALGAVGAFAGYWVGIWGSTVFLLVFLAGQIFALALVRKTRTILSSLQSRARDLELLSALLAKLELEKFEAPKLREIQASIRSDNRLASQRIGQLERLLTLHENGANQYLVILALVLLWHTQVAMAVEAWRRENGPHILEWLHALGEFEALSSLASYAYEHTRSVYPELLESGAEFAATGLGHPLLPAIVCVPNDVTLGDEARLLVVSGSNMSGKSTLLRSIGLNVVLAWAGAPVRADSMRVGPLALGASLRTVDSLQEGRSRFYAEITRLRQIADLAKGNRPLLFLLDELLSGTNSHDRRIGAEGIVKALLDRGAIGLITTHDLALAQIGSSLGATARNVHFEDQLENGEIHFDYKMRPGIVERSNALELMRAVGLLEP